MEQYEGGPAFVNAAFEHRTFFTRLHHFALAVGSSLDELAAVEPAACDGVADGAVDGVAEPLGVAGGVVEVPDAGWSGTIGVALTITGRNRSLAVLPSCLAWSPLLPGTEITMLSRPWVTTSASATPRPLTRRSMI